MSAIRSIGDMLHLAAIVILLGKMLRQRSAAGVSLKTQFLYALVFTTRYLDLLVSFYSTYNTMMKIFFLATSWHICFLMRYRSPWRVSYDRDNDTFRIRYLIIPCILLALLIHNQQSALFSLRWVLDICWAFSQYLECVAIMPQIFLLVNTERHDALTSHYIFALGAYRVFYILHWVTRYMRKGKVNWITVCAGLVQTILYADFFYNYVTQVVRHAKRRYDLAS